MSTTNTAAPAEAARIVEEYFGTPIRALAAWVDPCARSIADVLHDGPLTRSKLDAIVEPYALNTLELPDAPVYGAGFIAALELLTDAHSHLAWWQGADKGKLVLASQTVNKEHIDYSELEWYRVPMSTGLPHVAGPYVDYLCSDEYTITIAVPARADGMLLGVAGLDLLVSEVERELTPRFADLGHQVTLTNSLGRVVVSTDPRCATGDSIRGGRLADLPRVPCDGVALDVIVESR